MEEYIEIEDQLDSGTLFLLTELFFTTIRDKCDGFTVVKEMMKQKQLSSLHNSKLIYTLSFEINVELTTRGRRFKEIFDIVYAKLNYSPTASKLINTRDILVSIEKIDHLLRQIRVELDGNDAQFYRGKDTTISNITEIIVTYATLVNLNDYTAFEYRYKDFLMVRELIFTFLSMSKNYCMLRDVSNVELAGNLTEQYFDVEDLFAIMRPCQGYDKIYTAIVVEIFKINTYLRERIGMECVIALEESIMEVEVLRMNCLKEVKMVG